jgi:hypothetical protein
VQRTGQEIQNRGLFCLHLLSFFYKFLSLNKCKIICKKGHNGSGINTVRKGRSNYNTGAKEGPNQPLRGGKPENDAGVSRGSENVRQKERV